MRLGRDKTPTYLNVGVGELRPAYTDYSGTKGASDSQRLALRYGYRLSERTEIYGAISHLNNDGAPTRQRASSPSRTPAAGESFTGYGVGARHNC